ncbi:MAG: zinc ABC transporter solute-binding protein [Gammaproteobacteria bacterium]|jgi:protein SCO1/2|nr:zinc ABC transporter solute-binding protein [Gammaproteobacteria bacterium]MBT3724162.1 zinc ABC transporter solute-binding protein [Gammaproteobacteria bacterium]MBT4076925.1 zinc ABC transporter solute-binding protein [Gammaproteobacteria bacterium]MBT4194751.1 zinc ABC transporter solute-binding protein [Gammaproteobacteria bacterium]MBT4450396.1 zinc ABC transporter solute-binding protein [Gammaproteobacteria bacterium]
MIERILSGLYRVTIACLVLNLQVSWAAENFSVVTSIKPVHSIVSGLMKDIGEPELLIGDKKTPFNFELNQQQKNQLSEAKLFIWVGPELEKSLQATVDQLPESVKVVELLSSPDLKILPSRQNPDRRDPFFWMDDRNVMIMLDELTEIMIQVDPSRSHIYIRNRIEMLGPLRRIDKEYEYGYRGLKAGLGVLYYDNLNYFEQAYALKTMGHVSASPWDEELATNLLKVRARISSQEAVCLFLDKSMPEPNLPLLIEGERINIGKLDSLGLDLEAGPDLYLKLMEYNTDVIKRCLNADMDEAAKARLEAFGDDSPVIDGLGGHFFLTDHLGATVTEQDMMGKYAILFFGYTSCPDVCPTSLSVLTQAFRKMGDLADQIQPYFISVDPERDSVTLLREYVGYFDPRLIGLTGSEAMIKRVADQFKVQFEIGKRDESNPAIYTMDHTASLYLMAPDGSFVTKFAHGITPDALIKELSEIIH